MTLKIIKMSLLLPPQIFAFKCLHYLNKRNLPNKNQKNNNHKYQILPNQNHYQGANLQIKPVSLLMI